MSKVEGILDLEVVDELIRVAYWNDGVTPRSSMALYDLTTAAFPVLQECEGFSTSKSYQGTEIFRYLSDVCAHDQAIAFARRLVELEPQRIGSDGFTWVAASLHSYSMRLEELATLYKDEWPAHPDRAMALELYGITSQFAPYHRGTIRYEHPFRSTSLLEVLYTSDLNFFEEIVDFENPPNLVLNDVFACLKQGDFERQVRLLETLLRQFRDGKLAKDDLTRTANRYWSEVKPQMEGLEGELRDRMILLCHEVGRNIFCIDNINNAKKCFLSKQLSSMTVNQPWLALEAKNAGIPMPGKECRVSMKALEKACGLFERQWDRMVEREAVVELSAVLESLLSEVNVGEFSKRKMPHSYVSVLSTLMPNKGWLHKVSDQSRDTIFTADLGL